MATDFSEDTRGTEQDPTLAGCSLDTNVKGKDKAIPVQSLTLPDFKTIGT